MGKKGFCSANPVGPIDDSNQLESKDKGLSIGQLLVAPLFAELPETPSEAQIEFCQCYFKSFFSFFDQIVNDVKSYKSTSALEGKIFIQEIQDCLTDITNDVCTPLLNDPPEIAQVKSGLNKINRHWNNFHPFYNRFPEPDPYSKIIDPRIYYGNATGYFMIG